jgi:uncharacterized protein YndB with AHSA1/START domain
VSCESKSLQEEIQAVTVSFEISTYIPATPEEVYSTWMDSNGHGAMTGSPARIESIPGASFDAWDGYITGVNLELEPGRRILQSWRTVEFSPEEADSRLEVLLEPEGDGTQLTLRHTQLPEHGQQYEDGWRENYFEPMSEYYSR